VLDSKVANALTKAEAEVLAVNRQSGSCTKIESLPDRRRSTNYDGKLIHKVFTVLGPCEFVATSYLGIDENRMSGG
jgi:hypothetical protein